MLRLVLNLSVRAFYRLVPQRVRNAIESRAKRLAHEEQLNQLARESLYQGRAIVSLEKIPEKEQELITILADSFNFARQRQTSVSKEYLPSHEWKRLLEAEWRHYYGSLSSKDMGTLAPFLRNFLRNEGASGFWGGTKMFETFRDLRKIAALRNEEVMLNQYAVWRTLLPSTPLAELDAPRIGNPWGYNFSGMVLLQPVFEYHFQADYFRKLLCEIETPVVLEIGGGFGGLAYHLLRRGGSTKYIGLDLPENLLLQSYYLSCAFPDARILTYDKNFSRLDHATIDKYDIILLPNFMLPEIDSSIADLIINIRSLSEMASETIEEYFHQIDRIGRLFFFHENIFAPRRDGLWGVPSSQFPVLGNFCLIASSESRWPKYQADSSYPCQENLFIHRSAVKQNATTTRAIAY